MADPLFEEPVADPVAPAQTQEEPLSIFAPVNYDMPVVRQSDGEFENDIPPQKEVSDSIQDEDLDKMHTFPSIDLAGFFKGKRDPLAKLEPAEATVFMGNFVSRYAERMRRWSATGGVEFLSNALEFEAATAERDGLEIKKPDQPIFSPDGAAGFGGPIKPPNDPSEIYSHRLRNLSVYLRTRAEDYLQEREQQFPLGDKITADKFFADATSSILTSLGIVAATTAAATAAGVAAPAAGALALATTSATFGYMSFLEGFNNAQAAGASYEKSLAFSYIRAVGVSTAELAGLKSIFGKTFVKGMNIIGRSIIDALAKEGGTEGLQTVIELETDRQTGALGAQKVSALDYIKQVLYSSAVGAFAGGGMVASVAIPQKNRAIKALMKAGLDKNQAVEVYDKSMQETMDMIQEDVKNDVGYDEIQNMNDQRIFDIASSQNKFDLFRDYLGPREFPAERAAQQLRDNSATDRATPILNAMRTDIEATIRGEGGVQVPKISGIGEAESAVEAITRPDTPKEGAKSPIFQVAEPEFAPDTEPAMRVAIKGRVQLLNEKMKPLAKEYAKVQKELAKLVGAPKEESPVGVEVLSFKVGSKSIEVIKNPTARERNQLNKEFKKEFPNAAGEASVRRTVDSAGNEYVWRADVTTHSEVEGFIKREFGLEANQNLEKRISSEAVASETLRKSATLEAKEAELFNQLMDMYSEAEALRKNPSGANMEGDQIRISSKDLIRVYADFARDIIKTAKLNFKKGRLTTQGEFQFIRTMLNRMVDLPGLSKDMRNQLRGRFINRLTSKEVLMQKLDEIQSTIEEVRAEVLSKKLLSGVDRLVEVMTKRVGTGRGDLGTVKLDADSQALADIFVKEYSNKNTDPADIRTKLDGTPEVTMRWMASQLRSGKNGVTGRDLTPLEIASFYTHLKDFVQQGRQAKLFEAEVNKRLKARIISEYKSRIGSAPANAIDRLLGGINWATGTYDSLMGLFERYSSELFGKSFADSVFSVHNARRRSEILFSFYQSEVQQAMIKAYPELQGDLGKLQDKHLQDAVRQGGNSVHFSATQLTESGQPDIDADGVPQLLYFDFSRSEAREKYLLSLSPVGETALRKEGFNDEALLKLEQSLSPADKAFVREQLRIYADLYTKVNEVFRKIAGFDLPWRMNYSTIVTEKDFDASDFGLSPLYGKDGDYSSVQTKSYFKTATGGGRLKAIGDITKLHRYILDMSHYVGTAETVDRIQSVFMNREIQDILTEKFGVLPVKAVERHLEVLIKNTVRKPGDELYSPLSNIVSNMQRGFVASKPFNLVKQTTSMFAGIEIAGATNYFKYLKTLPDAWNSGELRKLTDQAYLHLRGTMNRSSIDMAQIERARTQGDEKTFAELLYGQKGKDLDANLKKYFENPTLLRMAFLPTQVGDFFGFVASTWPVYKHYLAQGDNEATALNKAIEFSNATQQSPDHTQMPAWALTANPIIRAMFAFKQAPIQYFNRVLRILNTIGTDNWDPKKFAQVYALYFVMLPALFDAVSDLFRPDDDWRLGVGRRLLVGLGDELVIVGPMWDWAITNALAGGLSKITGEDIKGKKFKKDEFSGVLSSFTKNIQDASDALSKVLEGDMSLPTVLKFLNEFSEATIPFTGTAGATVKAGVNVLEGVTLGLTEAGGDITKTWRRFFMPIGATRYATRPVKD